MKYFLQPFSSLPLIQEGQLSVTSVGMCTKYCMFNSFLVKLAKENHTVK